MNETLLIKPSICIPIYKSELNKFEIISIKSHIFKLLPFPIKSHEFTRTKAKKPGRAY